MSRSGPSKQVKRYVSANKKEIDDIRSGLGTVMAEIGKLRSEVQGDETHPSGNGVPTCHGAANDSPYVSGTDKYLEWLKEKTEPAKDTTSHQEKCEAWIAAKNKELAATGREYRRTTEPVACVHWYKTDVPNLFTSGSGALVSTPYKTYKLEAFAPPLADDKDAPPLTAAAIVSSGTQTAEPVYVRNGWTRTVEMTPCGVAILHEEQHVNDDMLLDPTTPAPSPTPIPVPVRSTKMGFLKRTAICGILATSAVGIGAIGVVGAFCIGAIDESHLLSGLEWAQEWRAQVASGGVTLPVLAAWASRVVPATWTRLALIWAAVRRLEEMGQTLAK